jgi:hypothetical protein
MKYTAYLPAGALDEEDPTALGDDGVDRVALALAEGSVRPGDRVQELEGAVGHADEGTGRVR